MAGRRVLMITQKVDLDDDVLGFTHAWVNRLADGLAHLDVLALAVGRCDLRDNVTLHSMGKEQGAGRLRRWINFNRVVAPLALGRRVDVVFVHMAPLYALLAAPWARLAGVPMVLWYAHGHVSYALRVAHRLVERVVSSTPEGFRLSSGKLVLVGQGIDSRTFRPAEGTRPARPFTVLSVGRLSPVKDYETLLSAADILVNQQGQQEVRFVLVGGAGTAGQEAYVNHLQARVAAHRLGDHVAFVGRVPHGQVAEYYRGADVWVSTSRTGSLDKAALEAMACGLPVVACNPAIVGLLDEAGVETAFRAGDAGQLAVRIAAQLRLADEARRSQGRRLGEIVRREHSLDGLVDRLSAVFEELA